MYKHDILCPQCKKEHDVKEHLFGKCKNLKEFYLKYDILVYEKVFYENITIERLKQTVKCIKELTLK